MRLKGTTMRDKMKIDKDIEIPQRKKYVHATKYPWKEMNIGDSFFVGDVALSNMLTQVSRAKKLYNKNYIVRKWTEGKAFGVRIWRVKK